MAVFCCVDVGLDAVLGLDALVEVEVEDVDDVLDWAADEVLVVLLGAVDVLVLDVDVDAVEDDVGADISGFDGTIPLFNAFA